MRLVSPKDRLSKSPSHHHSDAQTDHQSRRLWQVPRSAQRMQYIMESRVPLGGSPEPAERPQSTAETVVSDAAPRLPCIGKTTLVRAVFELCFREKNGPTPTWRRDMLAHAKGDYGIPNMWLPQGQIAIPGVPAHGLRDDAEVRVIFFDDLDKLSGSTHYLANELCGLADQILIGGISL